MTCRRKAGVRRSYGKSTLRLCGVRRTNEPDTKVNKARNLLEGPTLLHLRDRDRMGRKGVRKGRKPRYTDAARPTAVSLCRIVVRRSKRPLRQTKDAEP